jgi:transketolase
MRTTFIQTLCELAEQNKNIWLLTGDLGYSVLEDFAERFPDRFVNMGVAEQNMTGVAAGIALSDKVVFTYSISNFPTLRCLEQIRNDICYHNANVKIVAVGAGFAYGSAGYTHHGIEDVAVMRAMPNITILSPGDPIEVELITKATVNINGPCYIRLGKGGEQNVHDFKPKIEIGKSIWLRNGTDIAIISTGAILLEALQATEKLRSKNIDAALISMPTIKPLDIETIKIISETFHLIFVIEEHRCGGLGSAIAEYLASMDRKCILKQVAINDVYLSDVGSQSYLRKIHGLASTSIENIIIKTLSTFG